MIRKPLRPLASILRAREAGENPDEIEHANIRARHEEMRDESRVRAESRLLILTVLFFFGFGVIGARMGVLAQSEPSEPRADAAGAAIVAQRADIVDRHGRILATNFETHSLYAQPPQMVEPERTAEALVEIFPDLDVKRLKEDFTGKRKFLWVKKQLSPEQRQLVHNIGEPGLHFGPREMRLYPNGRLAAHVLGGSSFGREGVHAAEVIGVAGVEKYFDERLRDPAEGHQALTLSIDLSVQSAMERVLKGGMALMNAKGAAAVLLDVHTGEVIALASLPDFDPNERPNPPLKGNPGDSPLFNRAVQGVYELGSVVKPFTVAQALELKLVNPSTSLDTKGPMKWGRYKIRDYRDNGPSLSVTDVLVKSSNIGTARMAMMIGEKRQKQFLKGLGFFEPTGLEIVEAKGGAPLLPPNWSDLSTMTISYGHGLSMSPLHVAAGFATLANGGYLVQPTLLHVPRHQRGPRVVSERAADRTLQIMRKVVSEGTATLARVEGYDVAGKTGTADKPKPTGGGYYKDKVISTFASVFPAADPQYVLVVTLDEPVETSGSEPRRTAGWTAVPVSSEITRRVAPLLGLRPKIERKELKAITLSAN
ncbi:MAG: penicillin-binding protein 2 [Pseudomonadota bacterium]